MAKKNSRRGLTAESLAFAREVRASGITSPSISNGGFRGSGRASITRNRSAGTKNSKIFGGG